MAKDSSGPGEGHNRIGVDKSRFLGFVARIASVDSEIKIAREKRLKICREAKADGIKLGQLDAAVKVVNLDDEDARSNLEHFRQYLIWMRAAPGVQFDLPFGDPASDPLSDDEPPEEALLEKAERHGFLAGLSGKDSSENPHEPNAPIGQRWIKGYHEGVETAGSGLLQPRPDDDDDGSSGGEDDEQDPEPPKMAGRRKPR